MRRDPLLLLILAGVAAGCGEREETTMCQEADEPGTCPAAAEVDPADLFHLADCDLEALEVLGEGEVSPYPYTPDSGEGDLCCYPVLARDTTPRSDCIVGRPCLQGGEPLRAPLVGEVPRGALAGAWAELARMEHASVAAFARLSLELMALGAPMTLLAEVSRAMADEVEHTRLALAQAARFSGAEAPTLGPLPLSPTMDLDLDLASLAARAAREGCLVETLGAWLGRRMAERAEDPASRAALARVAEDEARHAALSWRVVAWAMATGGPAVREAVRDALSRPFDVALPLDVPGAEAHGAGVLHAADLDEAWREVIQPAAQALLAA